MIEVKIVSETIYSPFEFEGTQEEFEKLYQEQQSQQKEPTEREKYLQGVDFILEAVLPYSPKSKYRIKVQNKSIKLGKRGVTSKGNDKYIVTEKVLNTLQDNWSWASSY